MQVVNGSRGAKTKIDVRRVNARGGRWGVRAYEVQMVPIGTIRIEGDGGKSG
jgi:hypothetical protein